ncbi:MAG: hypothetical protein AAGU19_07930 [Prolixibacteraceae bacterium]
MKENLWMPDCIRTYTGLYMNVFEPKPEMINIEDIAHSLSMQCRFGGHLPIFFSVAQHSINCAALVGDERQMLAALLHDASEAYLLDIPRPIKSRMPEYKAIEYKLMLAIADKFGFEWPMSDIVKKIDEEMLVWEWNCIMLRNSAEAPNIQSQRETKKAFLNIYKVLTEVKEVAK